MLQYSAFHRRFSSSYVFDVVYIFRVREMFQYTPGRKAVYSFHNMIREQKMKVGNVMLSNEELVMTAITKSAKRKLSLSIYEFLMQLNFLHLSTQKI